MSKPIDSWKFGLYYRGMKLPTKLGKCPILEAFIEIHFKTDSVPDAVFGIIYGALKTDFPKVVKLPIAQLPDEVRKGNPELQKKPHFQLRGSDERHIVQVGPDVLTINNPNGYLGWTAYQVFFKSVWEKVVETGVITDVERVGVRYVNFFKENVFEKTKIKVQLVDDTLGNEETFLRSCLTKGIHQTNIHVTNRASVKRTEGMEVGSVIDIEAACSGKDVGAMAELPKSVEETRLVAKELFFSLLNDDFLKSLEAEFEVNKRD